MVSYDRVAAEVNTICDSGCWHTPKTDCPYLSVCQMVIDGNPDEYERTKAFENAMIARYMEIHGEAAAK